MAQRHHIVSDMLWLPPDTEDGPPVLAVEITSESTARNDLDETWGKAYVYGAAGVREYLVFDPTGDSLPPRVRAWRQDNGVFVPWPAEHTGRWQSREIAASFAVDGLFLRIYTADNVPVLFDMEARQALEDARSRAAALERRSQDDE